jgi:branched-subunit amino acid aminotransferase/4-amino-4-deoxychorismate lyase
MGGAVRPSIVVTLRPLQFDTFGPLYENGGIDLEVSLLTHHFAGAMDHRVKATSRGAWTRVERKTARSNQQDPTPGQSSMTVIFGDDGSIAEAVVANLCLVEGTRLVRPPRYDALEGVSLKTLCKIAEATELTVEERKFGLYDFINADATFVTATSFSLLPVLSFDGIALNVDRHLYAKLLTAWVERFGFDFVGQAQARLS